MSCFLLHFAVSYSAANFCTRAVNSNLGQFLRQPIERLDAPLSIDEDRLDLEPACWVFKRSLFPIWPISSSFKNLLRNITALSLLNAPQVLNSFLIACVVFSLFRIHQIVWYLRTHSARSYRKLIAFRPVPALKSIAIRTYIICVLLVLSFLALLLPAVSIVGFRSALPLYQSVLDFILTYGVDSGSLTLLVMFVPLILAIFWSSWLVRNSLVLLALAMFSLGGLIFGDFIIVGIDILTKTTLLTGYYLWLGLSCGACIFCWLVLVLRVARKVRVIALRKRSAGWDKNY